MAPKRLVIWLFFLGIITLGLIGGYFWWSNQEILPPTDIVGHVEKNPPSHIMDEAMPILIQKHMLEHADGAGPPGVVINYNCQNFACEPGLLERLKEIVNKYPDFVYLSPYPGMTKKIAVTSLGKIATFDEFNKEALIRFIEER